MSDIQVHVPFKILRDRTGGVIQERINPEVYLDGESLDDASDEELKGLGERLRDEGLRVTVHGPFMDLSPGAVDEVVRRATAERFRQALKAASYLGARAIVLHADYDDRRFDDNVDIWLSQSMKTWPEIVRIAGDAGIVIAAENIFETEPSPLKRLVEAVNSPDFGLCLDVGHLNIFSKTSNCDWLTVVGAYIKELHLHDNNGKYDEHLAVGLGNIDFPEFFRLLKDLVTSRGVSPIYTIEPHGEDAVMPAIKAVSRYLE
jgi:sugar phosphate isomerase/epimerase